MADATTLTTSSEHEQQSYNVANLCRELESDDVKTLTEALKLLILAAQSDRTIAQDINVCLRQCDLINTRRPYTKCSQLLEHSNKEVVKLAMGLIATLAPNLSDNHAESLFRMIEDGNYQENFKYLFKQKDDELNILLFQFQKSYLSHLHSMAYTTVDPWNAMHEVWLRTVAAYADPFQAFAKSIVGPLSSNMSVLGIKCLSYMGEKYGDYLRRILDENENTANSFYSIDLATTQVVHMLLEILEGTIYNEQKGFDSQGLFIVPILFSTRNAFSEIFCIAFCVFDITWKESNGTLLTLPIIREEAKLKIECALKHCHTITALRDALGVNRLLLQTESVLVKKSTDSDVQGLASEWNELLISIVSQTNKAPFAFQPHLQSSSGIPARSVSGTDLINLSKNEGAPTTEDHEVILNAIKAMSSLMHTKSFSWQYVTAEALAFLITCLTYRNWHLHTELSVQGVKFLEKCVRNDPDGWKKMMRALKILSRETNQHKCRPLMKMIRDNRTFPDTLRIINRLFEGMASEQEKRKFVSDLAVGGALPIIKTKAFSTHDNLRNDILQFQSSLLELRADELFDCNNEAHKKILINIWQRAFPNLPLNQLGPVQFELLGFQKYRCMEDFKGVKVQALTHLQHFAQHYTDIFQHLVLYVPTDPHELTIPVGDVGMLLSDALNDKLARQEIILPVLFDEREDSLSEVFSIVYLWLIQDWRRDSASSAGMATDAKHLLERATSRLVEVSKKNKSGSFKELVDQMGIDMSMLRSPWVRLRTKSSSTNLLALNTPRESNSPDKNSARSGKQPKSPTETRPALRTDERDAETGPDFVELYLIEHAEELREREKELCKRISVAAVSSKNQAPKPLKTKKKSRRNSALSEALKLSIINNKKLQYLTGERQDMTFKLLGDPLSRRKNELKEQKEIHKKLNTKYKTQNKKFADDFKV